MSSFTSRMMVGVFACLIVAACLASTARATIIADWQFEGATGDAGFLADSSGNGHTLSTNGAVVSSADVPTGGGVSSAYFGGAGALGTTTTLDLTQYRHIRVSWSQEIQNSAIGIVYQQAWAGVGSMLASTNEVGGAGGGTSGTYGGGYIVDSFSHAYGAGNTTWENFAVEYNLDATTTSGIVKVFKNGLPTGSDYALGTAPASLLNDYLVVGAFNTAGELGLVGRLDNLTIESIPEPGTIVLLANGLAGLLAYAWRRRR